jgi:RecA-family ATPase
MSAQPADALDELREAAAQAAGAPSSKQGKRSSGPGDEPRSGEALPEPYDIEPACLLADRAAPPPRDWIIEDLALAARRVVSMMANGGVGKTLLAIQIAIATALNRPLFGLSVRGGSVVGFLCEDEQSEIERRVRAICTAESIQLEALDQLYLLSRDGSDNMLCAFERDLIVLTEHYWRIDATLERIKPRLLILDTAADSFAGDYMNPAHVRQFIKVALGGFCARHGTAVLLIAHPSAASMATGDGGGFSTAWNNSVRSRLYVRRPDSQDKDEVADRRIIEVKKSNYGPSGGVIPLMFENGRFIFDANPVDEAQASRRKATKADTRLSMAVMKYFHTRANSGQVVAFGAMFKALQADGELERTEDARASEKVRKRLQRTLKALLTEHLIRLSDVPKGYRIASEDSE